MSSTPSPSEVHLYHLPLKPPTTITSAIYGNFSTPNATEFCVARGNTLEILTPDDNNDGRLTTIVSENTYGNIRSISSVRLWGGDEMDHIVLTSDSGAITVLSVTVSGTNATLNIVSQTIFGKTGCRRVVPGQIVSCESSDNGGRVLMLTASEKQKLVFKIGRNEDGQFQTSSPLHVDSPRTITFDCTALDVGTEHPEFACLEIDYGPIDDSEISHAQDLSKTISCYKMDLTLNNVVRTSSSTTIRSAHRLIAVPGGNSGPGGVLICSEGQLTYHHPTNNKAEDLTCQIPVRSSTFNRQTDASSSSQPPTTSMIVCHAAIAQREQGVFFCIVQDEQGDMFRIHLISDQNEEVGSIPTELTMTYFDTLPVCNAMCISRNGLFFAASDFGDHHLYRIVGDGSTTEVTHGKTSSKDNQDTKQPKTKKAKKTNNDISTTSTGFIPTTVSNLEMVDTIDSTAAILDCFSIDLCNEGTPQTYALCGRGNRSSLRVLRYGLPVDDFTRGAALPGVPENVWSLKGLVSDEFDKYMVVSFSNATLVLSVGEQVKEVKDSGFKSNIQTLLVITLADGAGHAQVHPEGILMVLPGKEKTEWKPPLGKRVLCAAGNERQLIIGLEGGTLVYFEMGQNGQMLNSGTHEIGNEITCVDVGAVPPGRLQSDRLIVGSSDSCVRLLSLSPDRLLDQLSLQVVTSKPKSCCLVRIGNHVHACVGLRGGVLVRTRLDASGGMATLRSRFLGVGEVSIHRISIRSNPAVVACCGTRTWLLYDAGGGRPETTPLSLGNDSSSGTSILNSASSFSSAACPDGIVATAMNTKNGIQSGTMRIFRVEDLGTLFNQNAVALSYTPRQMCVHKTSNTLVVVESDHNALPSSQLNSNHTSSKTITDSKNETFSIDGNSFVPSLSVHDEGEDDDEEEEDVEEELHLTTQQVGRPRPTTATTAATATASVGTSWASCLRVVDPENGSTLNKIELGGDEACFTVASVLFKDRNDEEFLVVGTAIGLSLSPVSHQGGRLRVYRYIKAQKKLMLIHTTNVEAPPLALCGFDGHLLVGVGTTLRMYSMGRKRLLRKCEKRGLPTAVRTINCHGDRICVGDLRESFCFVKYTRDRNELNIFADDSTPRYVTAATLLDYQTVAGSDKFGNLFVLRLPEGLSDDGSGSVSSTKNGIGESSSSDATQMLWDSNPVFGAANKLKQMNQYHVGDVITTLTKTSLSAGAAEVLLYGTVGGAIGAMLPMSTRSDVEFFKALEMKMRDEMTTISGWKHFNYRSYYIPLREVIDGSLCEKYLSLKLSEQDRIAESLDRTSDEIRKKIEDQRQRAL